jgi:ADP-heptose:LPS heptosyltransferase
MDRVAELAPQTGFWLLGTQSEHATGETVIRACSSARPVNLMGRTPIPTLAHLVAGSSALLCNDSGPMHLAAAVRTSVVALFGPTDPELTGPYGDGHITLRATCEDAPCFRRQCPRQAHAACHGRISEEETAQAVLQLLSEGTQARPTPDSSSEPRNDQ